MIHTHTHTHTHTHNIQIHMHTHSHNIQIHTHTHTFLMYRGRVASYSSVHSDSSMSLIPIEALAEKKCRCSWCSLRHTFTWE